MNQDTDSKRLVFLHVPKTAGTTFHSILHRQYSEAERFQIDGIKPHRSISQYRSLNAQQTSHIKLVHGHCVDLLFGSIPEPYSVLTFLRDPIKHLVSSFNYLKRATWNPAHDTVKEMKSIDEFIDFRLERSQDSIQARYLAGLTQHHVENPEAFSPSEIRKRAIQRLNDCDYVFTTDRFDEAMLILQKDFHWRVPFYKSMNVSQGGINSSELTERELSKASQLIEIDLEIFELAERTNNRKYCSLFESDEFMSRVRRFRNVNRRLPVALFKNSSLLRLFARGI